MMLLISDEICNKLNLLKIMKAEVIVKFSGMPYQMLLWDRYAFKKTQNIWKQVNDGQQISSQKIDR